MKQMKIKINKSIPGYAKGSTTHISVDAKGTPLDKFWRDRLHDAKTDKCVEIVKPKKPTEASK